MSYEMEVHYRDSHLRADRKASLKTYLAALGARASNPIDILFMTDSIGEGAGASAASKKFVSLLRDQLRSEYQPAGVAGGEGYSSAYTFYNSPWTYSGTNTSPTNYGLGHAAVTLAAGSSQTRTFTGTALDVFVAKVAGGGTLTVSVDGASSGVGFATIATANASQVNGFVTRVGGLTAGSHTVTVTASGAAVIFEGVMVYNGDEVAGIRTWASAHSGYTATAYANTPTWAGAVAAIQPDLVILELGVNDWRTSANTVGATNYGGDLRKIINSVRAACTVAPSAIVMTPYLPATGTNTGSGGGTVRFVDAALRSVAKDKNSLSLNIFERTGGLNFQTQKMGLLAGDNIHPSDAGHQFLADQLYGLLRR